MEKKRRRRHDNVARRQRKLNGDPYTNSYYGAGNGATEADGDSRGRKQ
jgi:hypothetical protein